MLNKHQSLNLDVLAYFPTAAMKYFDQNNLRGKGFILTWSSRHQELEAAGHRGLQRKRTMGTFPHFIVQDPTQEMVPSQMVGLLTSISVFLIGRPGGPSLR